MSVGKKLFMTSAGIGEEVTERFASAKPSGVRTSYAKRGASM